MFRKRKKIDPEIKVPDEFMFSQLTPPFEKSKSDTFDTGCAGTMLLGIVGLMTGSLSAISFLVWRLFTRSGSISYGTNTGEITTVAVVGFSFPFAIAFIKLALERLIRKGD